MNEPITINSASTEYLHDSKKFNTNQKQQLRDRVPCRVAYARATFAFKLIPIQLV